VAALTSSPEEPVRLSPCSAVTEAANSSRLVQRFCSASCCDCLSLPHAGSASTAAQSASIRASFLNGGNSADLDRARATIFRRAGVARHHPLGMRADFPVLATRRAPPDVTDSP